MLCRCYLMSKTQPLCNGPCMVSMQVVLLEDPVTSEAKMQAGGTKQVCNAKVAKWRVQFECGVLASFVGEHDIGFQEWCYLFFLGWIG